MDIFGLEPVVQFCELVFALVDDALFQALRVCNHGGKDATRARLGRCLDTLQTLEGAALDELATELQPYVTQFELVFLSLVRAAFSQHCVALGRSEDAMDVELRDDDLDRMPCGFLHDVFARVCATPIVRDMRYFEEFSPLQKAVLVDQHVRAAFYALVPRHARFTPIDAADALPPMPPPPRADTPSTPVRRMTPMTPMTPQLGAMLGPTPEILPSDSVSVVAGRHVDPPSFRDCVPRDAAAPPREPREPPPLPRGRPYDGTRPLERIVVLPSPRPSPRATPRLRASLQSAARSPDDTPRRPTPFSAGSPAWRATLVAAD